MCHSSFSHVGKLWPLAAHTGVHADLGRNHCHAAVVGYGRNLSRSGAGAPNGFRAGWNASYPAGPATAQRPASRGLGRSARGGGFAARDGGTRHHAGAFDPCAPSELSADYGWQDKGCNGALSGSPLERMAALQHYALPNSRRTGILLGTTTKALHADIEEAATSQRLDIRYRVIDSPGVVFPALTELSEDVDVLWLLPDPLIVNRNNLQSLFLQTYRQRLPILAYSSALVQAGAMLGLYATPAQFGHEAAQWLKTVIPTGGKPPPPRYPTSFVIAVNPTVARSLNVSLPSLEELTHRLNTMDTR